MSDEGKTPSNSDLVIAGRRYTPARVAAITALLFVSGSGQSIQLMMSAICETDVPMEWRIANAAAGVVSSLMVLVGTCMACAAIFLSVSRQKRPLGRIFDWTIPPADAEHRALELEIAFDKWYERYSPEKAWGLYFFHSVITIALYWYDRSARRTK